MARKAPITSKRKNNIFSLARVVLVLILFPCMLLVTIMVTGVKDGRKNASYCISCHQDPYYTSWVDSSSSFLAYHHGELGITCQSCHTRTISRSLEEIKNYLTGNYYSPLEEEQYSMDFCFRCHDSYDKIISLTSTKVTGKERNPHAGHYGDLECATCHKAHRESYDYCSECHQPDSQEPGWRYKQ